MGAQFTLPLIEVIPGQLIASALWNNEWNNLNTNFIPAGMDSYSDTDGQMQIQTNPFPGSVTSHATSLGGEIERIRYQISQILGATTPPYWYAAPPTNLTAAANQLIPIGGSILYPSATPPNSSFLLRNGQAISRTIYSVLFGLIGTSFGTGDGSTTFNIPNSTDRMPIGAGNLYSLAATGGAVNQSILAANLPAAPVSVSITDPGHNHGITDPQHSHGVTDPSHTHVERGQTSGGGTLALVRTSSGNNSVVNDSSSTVSSTTGVTVNNASTGVTTNNGTTGITAAGTISGSGTALPTLSPYLAEYWMMRVL